MWASKDHGPLIEPNLKFLNDDSISNKKEWKKKKGSLVDDDEMTTRFKHA